MTDEPKYTGSATAVSPGDAEPDEDPVKAAFERIMALQDDLEEHGVLVYNSLWTSPELWAPIVAVISVYTKAYLEALAKHHADATADRIWPRLRKSDGNIEVHIGLRDGSAAIIAVNEDLPDEARLAVPYVAVTTDDLRGKLLRWDSTASAWRVIDDN